MNTQGGTYGILHRIIVAALGVGIVTSGADCLRANVIPISSMTLDSTSTTGVSFVYSGTLTQNDSLEITVAGDPCLQPPPPGPQYCVNGAGVVIVPGTSGVGDATTFVSTFGGTSGTWDFGSVLMEISGISGTGTVQIFPADIADGLGSGSPSTSSTLPVTTLSALGFSPFSVLDPTITFVVADNLYTDNVGKFDLSQNLSSVPEPTTGAVVGVVVFALAGLMRRRRAARNAQ